MAVDFGEGRGLFWRQATGTRLRKAMCTNWRAALLISMDLYVVDVAQLVAVEEGEKSISTANVNAIG